MSPKQVIVFERVITNIGQAYDSNFGVFKVPYSGLYEFIVTIAAAKDHFVDVVLVKNAATLCKAHASTPDQGIGMCVAIVHATKDDDIIVRHLNGIGTHLSGQNGYSSFSGHLISADIVN
ncbi:uncharacterized protein LOC110447214 [Mizuhopecten yessoensis]|uniref:Elastin microfibril interfacer 2 n=1 Tax=Mizuhopecten yessoensis TaxID=6573 RepID=A0A210QVP9_MIZYE|nr:uncharacterized protein LOC110447214 [Mizuhopecten yessoensis]OWF52833.1 Elastin microfibril interfacer 2 [Mizuhopecten yessoensis]